MERVMQVEYKIEDFQRLFLITMAFTSFRRSLSCGCNSVPRRRKGLGPFATKRLCGHRHWVWSKMVCQRLPCCVQYQSHFVWRWIAERCFAQKSERMENKTTVELEKVGALATPCMMPVWPFVGMKIWTRRKEKRDWYIVLRKREELKGVGSCVARWASVFKEYGEYTTRVENEGWVGDARSDGGGEMVLVVYTEEEDMKEGLGMVCDIRDVVNTYDRVRVNKPSSGICSMAVLKEGRLFLNDLWVEEKLYQREVKRVYRGIWTRGENRVVLSEVKNGEDGESVDIGGIGRVEVDRKKVSFYLSELRLLFDHLLEREGVLSGYVKDFVFGVACDSGEPMELLNSLDRLVAVMNLRPTNLDFFFEEFLELRGSLQLCARLLVHLCKGAWYGGCLELLPTERIALQEKMYERVTGGNELAIAYFSRIEQLPENIREEVKAYIRRLDGLEGFKVGHEIAATKSYLEFLFSLPWRDAERPIILEDAEKHLNSRHCGMNEVKERLFEIVAARSIQSGSHRALCLVGPPGTGKTTICASFANAMNRKYGQLSMGGIWDLSDLKGHRRAYLDAMPGQLLTLIRRLNSRSAIILLDEIDKITSNSSIVAGLLEILDPCQSQSFLDSWLDVPFDISSIIFVCTANSEKTIHPAILDRLELIYVQGYDSDEKFRISRQFLIPKAMRRAGLDQSQLSWTDASIKRLIEKYNSTYQGVRELENTIQHVTNIFSLRLAEKKLSSLKVTCRNLKHLLEGSSSTRLVLPPRPGHAVAITSELQHVQVSYAPAASNVHITGNLDPVMMETAYLAYTFVKTILSNVAPFGCIHIHLPSGGYEKAGPHACSAIALSIFSLVTQKSVPKQWAITGELALSGILFPVPQLLNKIQVAKSNSIKHLILSVYNQQHWADIPAQLKRAIQPHFVTHFSQIPPLLWPSADR